MRKKAFTMILTAFIAMSLFGCSSRTQDSGTENDKSIFEMSTTEAMTEIVSHVGKNIDNLPDPEKETSGASLSSTLEVSEGIQLLVIARDGEIFSINVVLDATSDGDVDIFTDYSDAILELVGLNAKIRDMTLDAQPVEEGNFRYGWHVDDTNFEIIFSCDKIQ